MKTKKIYCFLLFQFLIFYSCNTGQSELQEIFGVPVKLQIINSYTDNSGSYFIGEFKIENFDDIKMDSLNRFPDSTYEKKGNIHKWKKYNGKFTNKDFLNCELIIAKRNMESFNSENLIRIVNNIDQTVSMNNFYYCFIENSNGAIMDMYIMDISKRQLYRINRTVVDGCKEFVP